MGIIQKHFPHFFCIFFLFCFVFDYFFHIVHFLNFFFWLYPMCIVDFLCVQLLQVLTVFFDTLHIWSDEDSSDLFCDFFHVVNLPSS